MSFLNSLKNLLGLNKNSSEQSSETPSREAPKTPPPVDAQENLSSFSAAARVESDPQSPPPVASAVDGGFSRKSREEVVNEVLTYTCTQNCCGVKGQSSLCCTISDRDWIIGPLKDTERFLSDLSRLRGREVSFDEVFLKHDEGSQMFPEKKSWQREKNYPALRVVKDRSIGHPCIFLDKDLLCTVHEIKPQVCKDYMCDHLIKINDLMQWNL